MPSLLFKILKHCSYRDECRSNTRRREKRREGVFFFTEILSAPPNIPSFIKPDGFFYQRIIINIYYLLYSIESSNSAEEYEIPRSLNQTTSMSLNFHHLFYFIFRCNFLFLFSFFPLCLSLCSLP